MRGKWTIVGMVLGMVVALVGCAATERVIDYSDMKTDVKMDRSIFLQPIQKSPKTVYVEVKNTTNRPDMVAYYQPVLVSMIQGKGYMLVADPRQADYIIQSNVRYLGEYYDGILKDGIFTGAAVGALSGLAIARSTTGVVGGALVGGALGVGADIATRTKTYVIAIDVRVTEQAGGRPMVHDCGVAASATKIWLTMESAAPTLSQLAAQQVSGIF